MIDLMLTAVLSMPYEMAMGDDGQAWKEAQKFLEMLKQKRRAEISN